MKRFTFITLALLLSSSFAFAEKAPQKIYDLANGELATLGTAPEIVAAVKAENAKGKSLDQIKSADEKWKNTAGLDEFMKSIQSNSCSNYLRSLMGSNEFYAEVFAMDNQGANVCMTDKTSDYWQGDEAKFKNSFNAGAGAVFVDEVEFDDSAQAYLVQVSVPVKDGNQVIGAITFGIDIDKAE